MDDPLPNIYKNGRSEDGIIARTWSMFKDDPTEPDVLLRLGVSTEVGRKSTGSRPEVDTKSDDDPIKITNDKRSCKVP